jgi:hypothetical protein
MKEQSGWAWNSITRLPNVSVGVMNDYVEVSFELFLNISTSHFLAGTPQIKNIFHESISDVR